MGRRQAVEASEAEGESVARRIMRVAPVELDEGVPEGVLRIYLDIPIEDAEASLALIRRLYMRWGRPVVAAAMTAASFLHADANRDGVVDVALWVGGVDALAALIRSVT